MTLLLYRRSAYALTLAVALAVARVPALAQAAAGRPGRDHVWRSPEMSRSR